MSSECLDELRVVLLRPVTEALGEQFVVFQLYLGWDWLKVLLVTRNLVAEVLETLEVGIELESEQF